MKELIKQAMEQAEMPEYHDGNDAVDTLRGNEIEKFASIIILGTTSVCCGIGETGNGFDCTEKIVKTFLAE